MSKSKKGRAGRASAAPVNVGAVCEVLEALAPTRLAQDWDNVGLLAGDRKAGVTRIMLCIDLMPAVVAEVIAARCQLVVAYHPPIFRPIKRLVAPSDGMEAGVLRCVSKGVAIYAPHTALDCARGGTNDVLAGLCDMTDPQPLDPQPLDPQPLDPDEGLGLGRIGALAEPISLARLARKLKRHAHATCVSIVGDPERVVRRAVVGVGAAGSMPFEVDLRRSDVVVTGEIRHHDALQIQRIGCSAIALSHWSSERPALASLAKMIGERLPGVDVRLSDKDSEPFVRV